jgi:hypothetical protein
VAPWEWLPVPGSADGCQVSVVGDSLVASSIGLHRDALAAIGCVAAVDGLSGRSLSDGWQCRVGRASVLHPQRPPDDPTCRPSGLELLRIWSAFDGLGDVVVVALGTNDAGLRRSAGWIGSWETALALTAPRPVVFVSTAGAPGMTTEARQAAYTEALRAWCADRPRCVLADWSRTDVARDQRSYADGVHLTRSATAARAAFLAAVTRAVVLGEPLPDPAPTTTLPSTPPTTPPATTSTSTTTTVAATTTSTTTVVTAPATTVAPTSTAPATTSTVSPD